MFNVVSDKGTVNYQERGGKIYTEDFTKVLVAYSTNSGFVSGIIEDKVVPDVSLLPFAPKVIKGILSGDAFMVAEGVQDIAPNASLEGVVTPEEPRKILLRIMEVPVGTSFYYKKLPEGEAVVTSDTHWFTS